MGKKIITILRSKCLLHWTYVTRCNFDMENALGHTCEGIYGISKSVFLKSCYKGLISSSTVQLINIQSPDTNMYD